AANDFDTPFLQCRNQCLRNIRVGFLDHLVAALKDRDIDPERIVEMGELERDCTPSQDYERFRKMFRLKGTIAVQVSGLDQTRQIDNVYDGAGRDQGRLRFN